MKEETEIGNQRKKPGVVEPFQGEEVLTQHAKPVQHKYAAFSRSCYSPGGEWRGYSLFDTLHQATESVSVPMESGDEVKIIRIDLPLGYKSVE